MSLPKFLTSKTFVIQLAIAFGIIIVMVFALMKFLSVKTHHGEEIKVPDLSKMQIKIADERIKELGLELILLDTVDFKKDLPPFSVVEQDPKAGNTVKSGRKIYVKVNAGEFMDVTLPVMKNKTYRQISANIKSLGLVEGTITYKPHIAKDIVIQVLQNGKKLDAGDKVKKNSKLDFILGDGKEMFSESSFDEEQNTNEVNENND
ncbi:PASTA domain-containing protein [Flavobacterium chuncheonense]|uniref:PASTA domain-containing protein n=1 Tax=Flavobacterium chuncheonense TaxID=2026653 RepID=A0ABW5YNQ0_9FLAO